MNGGLVNFIGMKNVSKSVGRTGRPPSGPKGEKVSEYQQLTIRLPEKTRAILDAARSVTGIPIWRLIDRAVLRYVHEQRPLRGSARRRRSATSSH